MSRRKRVWIAILLALLVVFGGLVAASLRDRLPDELWVLGGLEWERVCSTPAGAEVDYQSIATNGECISLWYPRTLLHRALRIVGISVALGGRDYLPTGTTEETSEGVWHQFIASDDS